MRAALLLFILMVPLTGAPGLTIEPVQGDGAIHNLRDSRFVEPVVRVLDNGQAVAGALVSFVLPQAGAGGSFGGSPVLTVTTGQDGAATARGFRPNSLSGAFEIRATVSHNGRTARLALAQINTAPAAAKIGKPKSRTYMLLGLIAGGAAAGALAALGGSSGPAAVAGPASPPAISPGPVRPPAVIAAGQGSIGGPSN